MFKRLLVPLDGSPLAERAVAVAARIARADLAGVSLLRVAPLPASYGPYAITFQGALPVSIERAREEAFDYLHRVAESAALEDVSTTVGVEVGAPAPAIVDAVPALNADLVVMSTHGRGGVARIVLGSVAQHVARYSPVPVLLLHADEASAGTAAPSEEHPIHLLVPLDGSQIAETALGPALTLGHALAGRARYAVHLLYVVNPHDMAVDCIPEPVAIGRAEGYLSAIAVKLTAGSPPQLALPVTTSVVVGPDIGGAILQAAEAGPRRAVTSAPATFDLVAMTTHGRGGLARWALGSVTERVLQGGRTPLLIVRPVATPARVAAPAAISNT